MKTTENLLKIITKDFEVEATWLIDFKFYEENMIEFKKLSPTQLEIESGIILKSIINIFKKSEKEIDRVHKKMYHYISIFYEYLSDNNRSQFIKYLVFVENKKYGI